MCRQDTEKPAEVRMEIDRLGIGGTPGASARRLRAKCRVPLGAGRHRGLVARGTPIGV